MVYGAVDTLEVVRKEIIEKPSRGRPVDVWWIQASSFSIKSFISSFQDEVYNMLLVFSSFSTHGKIGNFIINSLSLIHI